MSTQCIESLGREWSCSRQMAAGACPKASCSMFPRLERQRDTSHFNSWSFWEMKLGLQSRLLKDLAARFPKSQVFPTCFSKNKFFQFPICFVSSEGQLGLFGHGERHQVVRTQSDDCGHVPLKKGIKPQDFAFTFISYFVCPSLYRVKSASAG